eukprot:gb/GFBE01048365.1/.p1 GENE.gb/GFBE01048365.1/~~gb/GFBE01048365.1/.p1  ORF type:complete len:658 (+),score=174.26 gb/GFBE01048365.1/:1-1974(+)
MQTLKDLTSSLGDNASLQKLRDNLNDLPKRWLSRLDQPEDYLLGNVTGECNYHFKFKLEGGGFFQTGVLVASAESTPGGLPVPLKCKWKRRVGDMPVEIPGVTSNMYQISADDVGTDISVEAQPADADDGHHGVVVGEIGPFELDPATRRSLDNALGLGGNRFTVMQSRLPGEVGAGGRQDLSIQVSTEGVRVAAVQGAGYAQGREAKDFYAEYSPDYPKVIIHPLDTSKFQLVMSGSKTYHLIALSRTSRDLIALTIRCFHAKKYLSTASILQTLLPVQQPMAPGASMPATDARLDSCIVLERLAKELNRAMQQKEVSEKVLRNTNHEKKQLQEQLMETISGFTEVIEGLQEQCVDGAGAGPPPSVDRLQDQLREVNAGNQALQAELNNMRLHLDKLQQSRQAAEARSRANTPGAGPEAQVHQLKDERDMLKARLEELSSNTSSVQHNKQEQVHTQELKRLRQDVESLHNQKEQLRRQLQDQDKERQELQDNFLYVKGQLDKVQMRKAQSSGSGDGQQELQRHRQTLEAVTEERNRLSMRLEAVLNNAEKEKAYHEQSVERVMTANGRLLEERDRIAKEVERLSRMYSESVNQLQGGLNETNASGVFRTDSGSGPPADPAEMARVRSSLEEVDADIRKREQENESLKNRIRKLAVA